MITLLFFAIIIITSSVHPSLNVIAANENTELVSFLMDIIVVFTLSPSFLYHNHVNPHCTVCHSTTSVLSFVDRSKISHISPYSILHTTHASLHSSRFLLISLIHYTSFLWITYIFTPPSTCVHLYLFSVITFFFLCQVSLAPIHPSRCKSLKCLYDSSFGVDSQKQPLFFQKSLSSI
jgi:hypothetical protein